MQSTLEFMPSYVIVHFDDEENLQREIDYPDLQEHARIHADFREEINQFAQRMEREPIFPKTILPAILRPSLHGT